MTIGIDKIGFATSNYVLKLNDLAAARGTDPEKLSKGLLLKELSIASLTEDIVGLTAANLTRRVGLLFLKFDGCPNVNLACQI